MFILILAAAAAMAATTAAPPDLPWLTEQTAAVLTALVRPVTAAADNLFTWLNIEPGSVTQTVTLLVAPGIVALAAALTAVAGNTLRKLIAGVVGIAGVAGYLWLPSGTATITLALLAALAAAIVFGTRLLLIFPFAYISLTTALVTAGTLYPGLVSTTVTLETVLSAELALDQIGHGLYIGITGAVFVPHAAALIALARSTR